MFWRIIKVPHTIVDRLQLIGAHVWMVSGRDMLQVIFIKIRIHPDTIIVQKYGDRQNQASELV